MLFHAPPIASPLDAIGAASCVDYKNLLFVDQFISN